MILYLEQEVHEETVSLHLVLQLVEDDEGGEGEAGALWKNGYRCDLHCMKSDLNPADGPSPALTLIL